MTHEQREVPETNYLRALMKLDAAAWKRRILFDNAGPPPSALDPEQRSTLRRLRRVFHQKREQA